MLVDLIYISQTSNNESFIKSLMEYEFAPNVMALATDRMFCLADRLMFVMLAVQLARTSSNHYKSIVRDGIGSVMVDLCNEMRSAPLVETSNVNLFLECLAHLLDKPENVKSSLPQINSMVIMRLFSPLCASITSPKCSAKRMSSGLFSVRGWPP